MLLLLLNAREDDVKMGDEPTVGRIHLNDATEAVVRGMCRESEEIMVGVITRREGELLKSWPCND